MNNGFTLVELTVVIILIAVLAGMTIPRFVGATGSTRLREAARRLLVTAQYARNFAATHRCATRLVIDLKEQRFALEYEKDPERRGGEFTLMRGSLARSTKLESPVCFGSLQIKATWPYHHTESTIRFDPCGGADAAVVEITDGHYTYSLVVSPSTARVRLIEGKAGKLPQDRIDLDA